MRKNKNMRMRYASIILSGILAVSCVLPVNAEGNFTYGQYVAGSTGSVPDTEQEYTVITVATEGDLLQLAKDCQLDSWSRDKMVRLESDIVLEEGVGLIIPSFGGIFDGGGHTISNLEIITAGSAIGLFRYVQEGGVVRNLSVSGRVCPDGSKSQVGILAGVNYGRILNCSVSGTVSGDDNVGGIAGVNGETGEIRICQSAAIVTGVHYTGGICGTNEGILNNCENSGDINTLSPEVTYSLEDITIENIEDINSAENIAAHMDTGGIAGYSQGKIYYCSNSGTIGYQHVGYNVGGIVGRLHQGYLQNCTNTGHILGRKDVGGIAGQLEPFLEILYLNDKLDEIEKEIDKFMELLEITHNDLGSYSREAVALTQNISASLTLVSGAAGNLVNTTNDLWYIYNQELTGINNDLSRLNQELGDLAEADKDKIDLGNGDTGIPGGDNSGGNKPDISIDGTDITLPDFPWDENGNENGSGDGSGNVDLPSNLGIQIDVESYIAALRRFGEDTGSHLNVITSETNDRSGGIKENLDILNREMSSASDSLRQLTDVLAKGTEKTTANIDALAEQTKVLRSSINELRDNLFRYEGISLEDASDEEAGGELDGLGVMSEEEAYYDTSAFQQGKITLCLNEGLIEADTNVGGIVGQMATEYDFDPEEDISISGVESFNIEQTVKAVVRESRNMGDVTGKKNYVGGIVGKADFGAVISCESYGDISSNSGSYVGGVAGASSYCVRGCYFMGNLAGKDYVGGITGKGSDIFYCCAYPELDYSGEYAGSIAGQLEKDGILYGNYYVEGKVPGVDSIGYDGGATPLSYMEFCSKEGMPEAFSEFTVSFRADGRELASYQCHYGEAIDRNLIPEIPEKEGFYGEWPEFDFDHITGNRILEARYEQWVSSLASKEKDGNGKTKILVQGEFHPGAELVVTETQEGTKVNVVYKDADGVITGEYTEPLVVRVFCEDTEGAIPELWEEAGYVQVPAEVMGSYLEFPLGQSGIFRITILEREDKKGTIAAIAAGAAAILILALTLKGIRKHMKKKKSQAA